MASLANQQLSYKKNWALFLKFHPRDIFVKLANQCARYRHGRFRRQNVYLLKIVAKSFRDVSLDICKYKESNWEPVAGF